MINQFKRVLTGIAISMIALSARAGCDPDFGTRLKDWVIRDARRQAVELASADFSARHFNGRVLEYDALRGIFAQVDTQLTAYAKGLPQSSSGAPTLAEAVAVQSATSADTDMLFATAASLEFAKLRLQLLADPPSRARFLQEGAQHVGRSTLLSSVMSLGNEQAQTLNTRYSMSIRVDFDSSGKATGGDVKVDGNKEMQATDSVALALLQSPEPYVSYAAMAYLTIRFVIWGAEEEDCRNKIKDQRALAREAVQLLATTLPSQDEDFDLYAQSLSRAQESFQPIHEKYLKAYSQLDERWRGLVAVSLARSQATSKILTVEKLDTLKRAYGTTDPLAGVFNESALALLTKEVGALQKFTLRQELALSDQCRSVDGIRAAEDLIDTRKEAVAQLAYVLGLAKFAPLHASVGQVEGRLQRAVPRAIDLVNGRTKLDCPAPGAAMFFDSGVGLGGLEALPVFVRAKSIAMAGVWTEAKAFRSAYDGSFCTILRDGGAYRCEPGSGGNGGLRNEFPRGAGSDYDDVTMGSSDGGFDRDSRRLEQSIDAARANIEQRIADLRQRQANIQEAVPAWKSQTLSGMDAALTASANQNATEDLQRDRLLADYADVIGDLQRRLDAFVKDPGDPAVLTGLINDSGAMDSSLPDLPEEAVMPEGPKISGLTQDRRSYGNRSSTERVILRERRKGAFFSDVAVREKHEAFLNDAQRFAKSDVAAGNAIAEVLVRDAAAWRFYKKGALAAASYSVLAPDGSIVVVTVVGDQVPAASIEGRTSQFSRSDTLLRQQQQLLRQALSGEGAVDQQPRLRFLDASVMTSTRASQAFYGGDLALGEAMLEVAQVLADVATAWAPGVSWARDIYESVTGVSLISGEELGPWERGAAVLGAVSAGVLSKGPKLLKVIRALEKSGETARRVEKIIATAKASVGFMKVIDSEHFLLRLEQRGIPVARIDDALDWGARYWDKVERGFFIAEKDAPEVERVFVAVTLEEPHVVKTAYMKARSDKEILDELIAGTKENRYIHIPDDF